MRLTLCIAIFIFLQSCASYNASPAPVPTIDKMPAWKDSGLLYVGADPFVHLERQKNVFDANLTKYGVLPIQVLIQNFGYKSLLIRPSDMMLV